jgi:hypothetical protein
MITSGFYPIGTAWPVCPIDPVLPHLPGRNCLTYELAEGYVLLSYRRIELVR